MSSIIDSHLFHNVFSTPQMATIWSDSRRIEHFLQFEAALAKVQGQLGIIPPRAATEIIQHCKLDHIDFEELRKATELIGYPVLPVVKQIAAGVPDRLGEWAHWGATTQDLTDTAVILQLRDSLAIFEELLEKIIQATVILCGKYKTTPMAARSNLQQAVPMSFGFKIARLLASFLRHRERLRELKPRLLVLEFSGAAGTLATISEASSYQAKNTVDGVPLGLRCQQLLANELGLNVPLIAWHTERDTLAEAANFLAVLTATCAKFATDLKLLMQSEVGEASEPFVAHRGSSSTMPQKRNPIGSAYVCAMASSIRTMTSGMVEAVVADHERSTGPWEIEWVVLPQIVCLSHACLEHTHYLLHGLEVDEGAMSRNLALSRGAIVSEAVMMGLGRTIGRQYAHDVVYDLCRRTVLENKTLLELLRENEEVKKAGLPDAELEALCDPKNYLGLSEVMVDRVLERVSA